VALSLSGCVYLRLNTVRKQLENFDQFVTVGGEPDLALNFKHPVLWSEDMVFLFKQPPTEQREAGSVMTWLWVLEKKPGPTAKDAPAIRFTFTTVFTSNKLSQLVIPHEVLRVVPREAVVGMFKAMGHAQVNPGHRVVSATMRARSRVARVVLLPDYGSKENRIVRPGLGDRAGTGATGPGGLAATAAAPRGYSRELVAADCTLGPVTRRESGGPSPPSQLHRAPAAHSGREGTGVGGQSLCRFRGGGAASVAGRGAVQH
jgi:hypothetical protein